MKTHTKATVEAIVGTLVLMIAGLFAMYLYSHYARAPQDALQIHARFTHVDGLLVGNDVKIAGVRVGQVTHIAIDSTDYIAQVDMSLDNTLQLPEDTAAEIISESLMGGKYISLIPGGASTMLQAGEEIIYTQPSISFESLVSRYIFNQPASESETPALATP